MLGRAKTSATGLSQPLISKISDALTDTSDALSNQQNLVASFNTLMKKFEPWVKIGDEVAKVRSSFSLIGLFELINFPKIHPWVNLAWQVLSAGMKVR